MTIMNTTISGGGSTPVVNALNVTPSTSAQTITAPSGVDGYSPVNVSAVTSAIDANIIAGNIKKDVEILGVTGSYEGQAPTGTMYIISNGTYNVADKAIANVQVPTTAPASYTVLSVLYDGRIVRGRTSPWVPLPAGGTDITDYALQGAYTDTPANILSGSIDLSQLTKLTGNSCMEWCFNACPGLTSVDFSAVTRVSGSSALRYCFYNNPGLTSVDFSLLSSVSGGGAFEYAFASCPALTSFTFPALTSCAGNSWGNGSFASCFSSCSALRTVRFPLLSDITSNAVFEKCFQYSTAMQDIYFNALTSTSFGTRTNQFNNMLSGVTGCTIHFPSNLDPAGGSTVISSLSGYPNFGGTNTVLAFDLPATE